MEVYKRLSPMGRSKISKKLEAHRRDQKNLMMQTQASKMSKLSNEQKQQYILNAKLSTDPQGIVWRETSNPRQLEKERHWDQRIGLPISTYNTHVSPKYKITFEDL